MRRSGLASVLVVACLVGCTSPRTVVRRAPAPSPPPADSLTSASVLLRDQGGEVTLVRGLSPKEVLAVLAPGQAPRPADELCDSEAHSRADSSPGRGGLVTSYTACLTAQSVGAWTLTYGNNDLTIAEGGDRLLEKLSADGREVVYVADHFEADAPFVVAVDGRVVRDFDFCSEGSADEGPPLPEEQGVDLKGCTGERFLVAQRLTGIAVTRDLLLRGDRLAVTTDN